MLFGMSTGWFGNDFG